MRWLSRPAMHDHLTLAAIDLYSPANAAAICILREAPPLEKLRRSHAACGGDQRRSTLVLLTGTALWSSMVQRKSIPGMRKINPQIVVIARRAWKTTKRAKVNNVPAMTFSFFDIGISCSSKTRENTTQSKQRLAIAHSGQLQINVPEGAPASLQPSIRDLRPVLRTSAW